MATVTPASSYQSHGRDLEDRAKATAADLGDKASDMASKAGAKIESAMHSAEETAQHLAQQGREAGERVSEVAGNLRSAVDKSVREQPLTTLLVATALGFVLGALWKS